MKECLECGQPFDDVVRTSDFWKRQYQKMGALADICNACWKEQYHIDVSKR